MANEDTIQAKLNEYDNVKRFNSLAVCHNEDGTLHIYRLPSMDMLNMSFDSKEPTKAKQAFDAIKTEEQVLLALIMAALSLGM